MAQRNLWKRFDKNLTNDGETVRVNFVQPAAAVCQ